MLTGFGIAPDDLAERYLDLPLFFHYGRSNATVAYYGAKVTPADVQEALFFVPELQELVTSFLLIVGEDAEADKTLRLAFELADGRQAPKCGRAAPRRAARRARRRQPGLPPGGPLHPAGRADCRVPRGRHRPVRRADIRPKRTYIRSA